MISNPTQWGSFSSFWMYSRVHVKRLLQLEACNPVFQSMKISHIMTSDVLLFGSVPLHRVEICGIIVSIERRMQKRIFTGKSQFLKAQFISGRHDGHH